MPELRRIDPNLFPREHYEFFDAPDAKTMAKKQTWRSIKMDLGQEAELGIREAPWTAHFDFSTFEPADQAIIRVLVELHGPALGQHRWVLSEEHAVGIHSTGSTTFLSVNGQPINRGRLLTISPIDGPWVAKLVYLQTQGVGKVVRCIGPLK